MVLSSPPILIRRPRNEPIEPRGRMQINWGHPLSQGLAAYYLVGAPLHGLTDLVRDVYCTPTTTIVRENSGKGSLLNFNTANANAASPTLDTFYQPTSATTVPHIIQSTSGERHTSGSVSLTLGATPTVGNTLVLVATGHSGTWTAPTGFTSVTNNSDSSNQRAACWYRPVASGDGTSYSPSTSENDWLRCYLFETDGAAPAAAAHGSGTNSGSSTSITLTARSSNQLRIFAMEWDTSAINNTTPTSWAVVSPSTWNDGNQGHESVVWNALYSTSGSTTWNFSAAPNSGSSGTVYLDITISPQPSMSLAGAVLLKSSSVLQATRWLTVTCPSGDSSGLFCIGDGTISAGGLRGTVGGGGSTSTATASGGGLWLSGQVHSGCVTYNGAAITASADGNAAQNNIAVPAARLPAGLDRLIIGNSGTEWIRGSVLWAGYWKDRALTTAHQLWLIAEPYDMLEPITPPIFYSFSSFVVTPNFVMHGLIQ